MSGHLSFGIARSQLHGRILIPKYYDPELAEAAKAASVKYVLPALGSLLAPDASGSRLGTWIPREHYGTGPVPFVRTSDFNGWRVRPDYKKGVAQSIYDQVSKRQDIAPGDILMVAHGTYLVGTVAIVTEEDLPLVLQDHVFRLRVSPSADVDPYLLLAALSTRFVRRQVRAKQFSADIIDKIGDRHLEIKVPLPKKTSTHVTLAANVRSIVAEQDAIRRTIGVLLSSDMRMTREKATARYAFPVCRTHIAGRILIPKYYDPVLREDLEAAERSTGAPWVRIGDLAKAGLISIGTGIEVGKMAYGTGTVPFIRTTDIADLEVKADPRQGVGREIYKASAPKAAVSEVMCY